VTSLRSIPATLLAIVLSAGLAGAAARPAAAQSRAAQLNTAGWQAIEMRNPELAARLFAEALTLKANDPVLLFGAGVAEFMQGRTTDATWRLQRALDLNPRLTEASRLLGRIAHEAGDLDGAIAAYEQALKFAPTDQDLAAALDAWRKEGDKHGSFTERRDQNFTILYEGRQEEAVAIKATALLEASFRRISARLGVQQLNTIFVVLYTERQFRDLTNSPEWADGIYDGRIRVATAGASQDPVAFERILTHELTHAMVWGLAPRGVPAWLHEGLAQYFAGVDVQDARRRLKARNAWVPLKDLEKTFTSKTAAEARIAYDTSLVAASLVVERAGFGWATFFSDVAEGQPCESVLIRRFGYSYGDLEDALKR